MIATERLDIVMHTLNSTGYEGLYVQIPKEDRIRGGDKKDGSGMCGFPDLFFLRLIAGFSMGCRSAHLAGVF